MRTSCYLDHNATTPLLPEAADAMRAAMEQVGNPSSVHALGRAARRIVEDAREAVAHLVGAAPAAVVFTSGGTEANALALAGCGRARVLVSAVEHASVRRAVRDPEFIPVDEQGVTSLAALDEMLRASPEPAVVSVMLANNETGVIQPVAEIADLAHRRGALIHCDAVQGPGRIPVDCTELGVDLLSLSAHKLGGPAGVGALVVAEADALAQPLLRGGGQEGGRRAGTENVIGIAGFGAAASCVAAAGPATEVARLRDRLDDRLLGSSIEVRIFGRGAPRLPNTTCVTMPGVDAETQVIALDLAGICVSAGAACSSGKVTRADVLAAMGVGEEIARTAIRVSIGRTTDEAEVDRFFEAWIRTYERVAPSGRAPVRRPRVAELA